MQLWIFFAWFCLIATANVVYSYVVTHRVLALQDHGAGVLANVSLYVLVVLVGALLHALLRRPEGSAEQTRFTSVVAFTVAAISYVALLALVSLISDVSFGDVFRVLAPAWLFVALPVVLLVAYVCRMRARVSIVEPRSELLLAVSFLIVGVLLYAVKALFSLSGAIDEFTRLAIVLVGIVLPAYYFVGASIESLSRREGAVSPPVWIAIVSVVGALVVPLLPIIG